MTGYYALAGMGAVCLAALVIVYAALRSASRAGAEEAEAEATKRMMEAIEQERRDDAERAERMAEAAAAVATEPAQRIRDRLRKRDPATK